MGAAAVTGAVRADPAAGPRPAEFREALELALAAAQADETVGPAICATDLRLRFEFTDSGLALSVWAGPDRRLRWSFEAVEWEPRLVLSMTSEVANRYLQGRESLAIAIAHGQVKVRGEARAALRYLPATRLICAPYRRVIETGFPGLAV